jgi:hypothetical protein
MMTRYVNVNIRRRAKKGTQTFLDEIESINVALRDAPTRIAPGEMVLSRSQSRERTKRTVSGWGTGAWHCILINLRSRPLKIPGRINFRSGLLELQK